MNLPKLDLPKHFCKHIRLIHYSVIGEESLGDLFSSDEHKLVIDGYASVFLGRYKKNKKAHSVVLRRQLDKCEEGHWHLLSELAYEHGEDVETEGTDAKGLDFENYCSVLANAVKQQETRVTASYLFPLEKYAPPIKLPYKRTDIGLKDEIDVLGLDFAVGSGEDRHRQLLAVYDDKHISVQVALRPNQRAMTVAMTEEEFIKSNECAMRLLSEKNTVAAE